MTRHAVVLGMAAFALFLFLASAASADGPRIGGGGGGSPNPLPGRSGACWSEPPDLNGFIGGSEQILVIGLQDEIANDFVVSASPITTASWGWGWYDESGCDEHPATPGFNLRFYEAGDCLPGTLIAELSITNFTEEYLGCQDPVHGPALYRATTDIAVDLVPNQTYWCGVQVKDHTWPPEAGRLSTAEITGCESAFKSVFFGYPDWVPSRTVWGFSWDASQEFWCGATPVEATSWGRVKAMFR